MLYFKNSNSRIDFLLNPKVYKIFISFCLLITSILKQKLLFNKEIRTIKKSNKFIGKLYESNHFIKV